MRNHYLEKTKEILKMPQVATEKRSRASTGGRRKRAEQEREEFVNDSSDLGEYDEAIGEQLPSKRSKVCYCKLYTSKK